MRECASVTALATIRESCTVVYMFSLLTRTQYIISVEQNIIQNHMCHVLVFNTFVFIFLFFSAHTQLHCLSLAARWRQWSEIKREYLIEYNQKKPNHSWWNHIYRRKNCKWIKALSSEKTRELMNYKMWESMSDCICACVIERFRQGRNDNWIQLIFFSFIFLSWNVTF